MAYGLVHDSKFMEYSSQPSRPDWHCTLQYEGYMGTEEEPNEVKHHIIHALRECLEEIDVKGKEVLKKIVSNMDVEIPLGRLAREALGDSRANDLLEKIRRKVGKKMNDQNHDDFVVAERGVSIDEELNRKLERFKVKTVNIGGVVTENNN